MRTVNYRIKYQEARMLFSLCAVLQVQTCSIDSFYTHHVVCRLLSTRLHLLWTGSQIRKPSMWIHAGQWPLIHGYMFIIQ